MFEAKDKFSLSYSGERPVRPVLLASSLYLAEFSLYLQRLLTGLADESIPVAIVCPDSSETQPIVTPSVEIIKHPAIKLPLMGRANRKLLIDKLNKFKPTVIHCLCETQAALARQVSKQLNIPYILSIKGLTKYTGQLSISANRLSVIIAPAESVAADIAKNYPRLKDRVKLIKPGTFVPESTACCGKQEHLAVIAAACSAREKTDFGKFLSAVKRLAVEGCDFLTIIIGDHSNEKPIRSAISRLGISEIVSIVPRKEPWREVLSACDIFIEPNTSNFFNPVLLEALSVGTAVAGYKGGVDDLIVENQTAAILDNNDQQNIYACLRRLLDNPQLAENIAVKAQDFIRKNHTVSKMVTETIDCYRRA
jgi:glycosyltransferase involved in cell wall biosynthesis